MAKSQVLRRMYLIVCLRHYLKIYRIAEIVESKLFDYLCKLRLMHRSELSSNYNFAPSVEDLVISMRDHVLRHCCIISF